MYLRCLLHGRPISQPSGGGAAGKGVGGGPGGATRVFPRVARGGRREGGDYKNTSIVGLLLVRVASVLRGC